MSKLKPTEVLRRAIVTEKSFAEQGAKNVYTFEVDRRADKDQIAKAVETLFNVNVLQVKTLIVRGKVKRFGRTLGKRSNWKKAYVHVEPGQTIPVFEGA